MKYAAKPDWHHKDFSLLEGRGVENWLIECTNARLLRRICEALSAAYASGRADQLHEIQKTLGIK